MEKRMQLPDEHQCAACRRPSNATGVEPVGDLDAMAEKACRNPDLAAYFAGVVAKHPPLVAAIRARTEQEAPPIAAGRQVRAVERCGDVWLRRELVPCRSARCHKKPDLHGPYWYSYRFLDGCWRATYHGVERPELRPPMSLSDVEDLVSRLARQDVINDGDLLELSRAIACASGSADERATNLQARAVQVRDGEHQRRDEALRDRYHALVEKRRSGALLTPEEQAALDRAADLLAADH